VHEGERRVAAMTLYHTSSVIVECPDTTHSREFLDFGKGFYLTTIKEQACKYAKRFKRLKKPAWLNIYELKIVPEEWRILEFKSYSREWLHFVVKCRSGIPVNDYDLIIGGIANDKVIETLTLFFDHLISEDEALGRLKFEKPNIQYCIRSEKLIKECLTYIESQRLP
jgi:hypothetical protein